MMQSQNVKFCLESKSGEYLQEIECKVDWSDADGSFEVDFFDRMTGYSNKSSAYGAWGTWHYPRSIDNLILRSLCEAVDLWGDWVEHLSWINGDEDIFTFRLTSELPEETPDDYEFLEMERV